MGSASAYDEAVSASNVQSERVFLERIRTVYLSSIYVPLTQCLCLLSGKLSLSCDQGDVLPALASHKKAEL
jgi:hypothetical protein